MSKKKAKPKASCDCIAKVNEAMEAKGSNTRLSSSSIINFKTGKFKPPRVVLGVEKDDSKKRERLTSILPSYCPICGKKYE